MPTVRPIRRISIALVLVLLLAPARVATAGETWGNVTATQSQVVVQPVGPILPRAKPMYLSGYAGTTYPPVGTRWRAMRSNYQQAAPRGWFAKFRNPH